MPGFHRTFHGAAGEHLVLGELLKRHFDAYLARGRTQPGWDILVAESGGFKKVEVKAIDWPPGKPVNFNAEMLFDAMVVVLLRRCEQRSRFLVLTAEEVKKHCATPDPERKNNEITMTVPKDLHGFECCEDRWDKVGANPVCSA